jgi:hypothetical protein
VVLDQVQVFLFFVPFQNPDPNAQRSRDGISGNVPISSNVRISDALLEFFVHQKPELSILSRFREEGNNLVSFR